MAVSDSGYWCAPLFFGSTGFPWSTRATAGGGRGSKAIEPAAVCTGGVSG
jgi:hypothetical protein